MKLEESSHAALAGMLDIHRIEVWSDEYMRAMLKLQLAMAVGPALVEDGLIADASRARMTFRELLMSAEPDLEVLEMVRVYGKAVREHLSSPVSTVRRVIYFAALAASRGRLESGLTEQERALGNRWARGVTWVDEELKRLF